MSADGTPFPGAAGERRSKEDFLWPQAVCRVPDCTALTLFCLCMCPLVAPREWTEFREEDEARVELELESVDDNWLGDGDGARRMAGLE